MLCKDIIKVIEDTYPKSAAEEWDNVGLLVGRSDKEIRRIFVAVDATDEVIEEAISRKADLLLTHHPLIFSPFKQITDQTLSGRRIIRLLQNDICCYGLHTNYDVLRMATLASDILGLSEQEVMDVTNQEFGVGIGKVGYLPEFMTVQACAELVKEKFHLDCVKVYGDLSASIQRVAISPGSGKHLSEIAVLKGAKAFITAEIDHHEALDANAMGMAILDAGHYGLEHIFIQDIIQYLQKNTQGVELLGANISFPFCVIT